MIPFSSGIPLKSSLHPTASDGRPPRDHWDSWSGSLDLTEHGGTTGENRGFIWDLCRIDVDVLGIENGDLISFTVIG